MRDQTGDLCPVERRRADSGPACLRPDRARRRATAPRSAKGRLRRKLRAALSAGQAARLPARITDDAGLGSDGGEDGRLLICGLELRLATDGVRCKGHQIRLGPKECNLLRDLIANRVKCAAATSNRLGRRLRADPQSPRQPAQRGLQKRSAMADDVRPVLLMNQDRKTGHRSAVLTNITNRGGPTLAWRSGFRWLPGSPSPMHSRRYQRLGG